MIYASIRISTKQQRIDRRYEKIRRLDINGKHTYIFYQNL